MFKALRKRQRNVLLSWGDLVKASLRWHLRRGLMNKHSALWRPEWREYVLTMILNTSLAKETQMYRTIFWTLWEKAMAGWYGRMALKHVNYHMWNESPVQVRCMIQGAQGWCTGMTQRDGRGNRGGRGVQDREHMYTHGGFTSMYSKTNTIL